jgi:hypothetical protein
VYESKFNKPFHFGKMYTWSIRYYFIG